MQPYYLQKRNGNTSAIALLLLLLLFQAIYFGLNRFYFFIKMLMKQSYFE